MTNIINAKILVSGGLLVLTLVFGFILTKLGKPYNPVLFNVHKLIALGFVIYMGIQAKQLISSQGISTLIIISLVLLILGVIGLFSTGAMMSIGFDTHHILLRILHVAATISILSGYGLLVPLFKL